MRGARLTAALLIAVSVACTAQEPPAQPAGITPASTSTPGEARDRTSGEPAPSTQPPRTRQTTRPEPTVPGIDQHVLDERLIAAAWRNDLPAARRLIGEGADVNAKDSTEQSAYLIATSEGYLELLDLTLRHGADVDSLDSFNGTGLIRAAERGHAVVVARLVREGVEVDHVNRLGWTALHEAIVLGDESRRYVDTVRVLVAAGADLRLRSEEDGLTPLQLATERGQRRVVATLQAGLEGGPPSRRRASDAVLAAARSGDPDQVAVALRAGAPLETRDPDRRTPLLLAAIEDRVAVARLLVLMGADPDAQDYRQDSAWLVTGVTGSVAILETLLPADPDLTLPNRYGGLSVIPASERGHVAYVRRVVRTDIDVNHVNDLGWTALLEAIILGDGSTPYQVIVRILLTAGADPELADADGVTPLAHARSRGYDEIAGILRRASD